MTNIKLKQKLYLHRSLSGDVGLLEFPHVTNIISSNELQNNLLKAGSETEMLKAFVGWSSQHGAFSDISAELWEKMLRYRSPPKPSGKKASFVSVPTLSKEGLSFVVHMGITNRTIT